MNRLTDFFVRVDKFLVIKRRIKVNCYKDLLGGFEKIEGGLEYRRNKNQLRKIPIRADVIKY